MTLAPECPEEEPEDFSESMSEVIQDEGPFVVLRGSESPGSALSCAVKLPSQKASGSTPVVK